MRKMECDLLVRESSLTVTGRRIGMGESGGIWPEILRAWLGPVAIGMVLSL